MATKTKPVARAMTSPANQMLPTKKPPMPSALSRSNIRETNPDQFEEYMQLATKVGINPPHVEIERFRAFLIEHNITVFPLPDVIAYMNTKAKNEGTRGAGWMWKPLRRADNIEVAFGTRGQRIETWRGMKSSPASDFYRQGNGGIIYSRLIPLHALRKVALIEQKYKPQKQGSRVLFMVSDYAPRPSIQYPDPFLMAVIPNPNLATGEGRFVIDFWDEPGFGLEQQLGVKVSKRKR